MTAPRRILMATDLSPCSMHALGHAQAFANRFAARIDLMHVWSEPTLVAPEALITGAGIDEQPLLRRLQSSARELLSKFESDAVAAGIVVSATWCDPGDPATCIVERARRGGYDLLVLGTHGHSMLSAALLGSVAEKVVRRAPCPVLTVRSPG